MFSVTTLIVMFLLIENNEQELLKGSNCILYNRKFRMLLQFNINKCKRLDSHFIQY